MYHFLILFYFPSKTLPILGYNSATSANGITDSPYTVSLSRPTQTTDIVDKQYVDPLTDLVSGGGINRVQNGLQLDSNVYVHSTSLAQNWTKFLPIAGSNSVNGSCIIE